MIPVHLTNHARERIAERFETTIEIPSRLLVMIGKRKGLGVPFTVTAFGVRYYASMQPNCLLIITVWNEKDTTLNARNIKPKPKRRRNRGH